MWTDDRVDYLKKRWGEGASASEISTELACGLSRSAVLGKVHRLELPERERKQGHVPLARRPRRHKLTMALGITAPHDRRTTNTNPLGLGRKQIDHRREADGRVEAAPMRAPIIISTEHKRLIWELDNCHCRWPIWAEGTPAHEKFYCGHPSADVINRLPYCAAHMRVMAQGSVGQVSEAA